MPSTSCPYAGDMPGRQKIPNAYAAEHLQSAERHLRFATARLGLRLSSGATILHFGCGIGTSVQVLLGQGYNAFGVDVSGDPVDESTAYQAAVRSPLAQVRRSDRLPVAIRGRTFDFCFSDNVFEHIFDYQTVMSEIMRVLKPAGSLFNNFPGLNLMEGHVGLPFPWLCFTRWYLTLCAWLRVIRGTFTGVSRSEVILRLCASTTIPQRRGYEASPAPLARRSVLQRQRSSCSEEAGAPLRCLNTSTRSISIDWQPKSRDLCFFSDI